MSMGFEIGRLLEVGVAVKDLAAAGPDFSRALQAPISGVIEEADNFAIRFQMCRVGDVDFEVMESAAPNGLIEKFIRRRGEGLHHIAFLVNDAEAGIAHFKAKGVPVLSDAPVRLANLRAFFLHPACLNGVLVEFVENLHPWLDGVTAPRPTGPAPLPLGITTARITGIGIRVSDLAASAAAFQRVLGAKVAPARSIADLGVHASICRVDNVDLILMQAVPGADPEFLPGPADIGIHHVSMEVGSIDQALTALEAAGGPSRQWRRSGIYGGESVFVDHPRLHGTLIELRQRIPAA